MNEETMAAMMSWMPILFMVAIFYFLLYKPQQKARRERETMLNRLRIGSRVVTIGGIYGTIDEIDGEIIKLEIAENVIIDVNKGAVNSIVAPQNPASTNDDDDL